MRHAMRLKPIQINALFLPNDDHANRALRVAAFLLLFACTACLSSVGNQQRLAVRTEGQAAWRSTCSQHETKHIWQNTPAVDNAGASTATAAALGRSVDSYEVQVLMLCHAHPVAM
jgi:hypothetical protein